MGSIERKGSENLAKPGATVVDQPNLGQPPSEGPTTRPTPDPPNFKPTRTHFSKERHTGIRNRGVELIDYASVIPKDFPFFRLNQLQHEINR